ncbi:MAG: amidohydrolase/deacetylase family metallohydrolase [Bryobacteraceae bacterium]|nr:amidohydrolase/deacetylase family metallohydrolase [Bryobacterales bacterium]MEB2359922.1 amidohydrolase/deacetylase family metallohydrolase [Bryobacterales bacterium]NUN01781.1 amidohydrolase/deacetylase family metallohydrolase [Bryobacteraceae bacterium]
MKKTLFPLFVLASALHAQTYDLLLKGGHVIDPKNKINAPMDVAVAGGKITRIGAGIPASQARRTVDVSGLTVTPGLIDIHVHVYPRPENKDVARDSNVQADAHTFRSGVTTVVDAGTSGADNFADFRARVVDRAQTRVLALLNIAAAGMGTGKEDELSGLDPQAAVRVAKANRDVVVGFKSAHFAGPGWESIEAAVKAGTEADMPVMVDFGYLNQIRNLPTLLLDKLRPGDIYTHCYSGHREELLPNGKINPAMFTARKRGIVFDVGFGAGSFYWYVAVPGFEQGFPPDSISTDLHTGSMNSGMKDMTNVMSAILNQGSTLEDVIRMSTWNPARQIKRQELGNLDVGSEADITVLRTLTGDFGFIDSAGAVNSGRQRLIAELTLRKGRVVWDLNGRAAESWKTFKYDRKKWTK